MLSHTSVEESRAKIHFNSLFREGINHFIYIPPFSLRVYLVLAKSKIGRQFSSQIDLYCEFFCRYLSVSECL